MYGRTPAPSAATPAVTGRAGNVQVVDRRCVNFRAGVTQPGRVAAFQAVGRRFKSDRPLQPISYRGNNVSPITQVNIDLCKRYIGILEKTDQDGEGYSSNHHLIGMCQAIIDRPEMYEDKQSRFIGFVQAMMIQRGLIDTNSERDLTRPLFHKAYREMGLKIPDSVVIE